MSQSVRAAVAGALAAAVSLAISELAAGVITAIPSLIEAIGGVFIDNVPGPLKQWAIDTFGTNDKVALIVGIAVVSLLLGAGVGVMARRRFWVAVVAFVGSGVLGAAAAGVGNSSVVPAVIGAGLAVLAGLVALSWLYGRIESDAGATDAPPRVGSSQPTHTRRKFIAGAGAVVGIVALSAGTGRALLGRAKRSIAGRAEVALPVPVAGSGPPADATSFDVADLSPLITPNDEFYKIDTTLSAPRVDLDSWTLRVHGMVDREYEISFGELLDMDMVERHVTLSCVSNEVGGHLVGNAKWLGVPLTDILDRAGVGDGAEQIVGRDVEGFTVGFPVAAAFDGREALVAVGMNDEPLPFDHGFPARLVVAGLYGYVSATKWLAEIELTTWDGFDAYWVPRGWSKEGPVKTQSRIDTPRRNATIPTGERAIAGVAWAPNRGISSVEVRIDEGAWSQAELADSLDDDSWRQWMLPWSPQPGRHRIEVRATDGDGETQTSQVARPAPNGASGWHAVTVTVEA